MSNPDSRPACSRLRRGGLRAVVATIATVASASALSVGVTTAIAGTPKHHVRRSAATLEVGTAKVVGRSEKVLVNSDGVTLYTLSGETASHLKCVTKACFKLWPPYLVTAGARLTKAAGVSGRISKLHRVKDKFFQVMLNGHPLYTFAPDKGRRGSALGEGIKSFGGVWHVVALGRS